MQWQMQRNSSSNFIVNALRAEMFHKVLNPEKLPPSQDALYLHLKRSMYQMSVWEQAKVAKPNLQLTTECGWCYTESGELVPIYYTTSNSKSV